MGIIRRNKMQERNLKLSVRQMQRVLPHVLSWEYIFYNVYYHHSTEADALLISKSGYLTEVEIKLSISDLKADFSKDKRGFEQIKYFYYMLPENLIEQALPLIDTKFGIISVSQNAFGFTAKTIRESQILSSKKISKYLKVKLFRNLYYKHKDILWHYNNRLDDIELSTPPKEM